MCRRAPEAARTPGNREMEGSASAVRALFAAVKEGDSAAVSRLLDDGTNVNSADASHVSP